MALSRIIRKLVDATVELGGYRGRAAKVVWTTFHAPGGLATVVAGKRRASEQVT